MTFAEILARGRVDPALVFHTPLSLHDISSNLYARANDWRDSAIPAELRATGVTKLIVEENGDELSLEWGGKTSPVNNPACFLTIVRIHGSGSEVTVRFGRGTLQVFALILLLTTPFQALGHEGSPLRWFFVAASIAVSLGVLITGRSNAPLLKSHLLKIAEEAIRGTYKRPTNNLGKMVSMNPLLILTIFAAVSGLTAQQPDMSRVIERSATSHPIHYFVSLPPGWNSQRTWPVLIVIPDAEREFRKTAAAFAAARGSTPFVIVVPMVLGGGGTAQQHKTDFDYPDSIWSIADRVGGCDFDEDGLTAVLDDVRRLYHTDSKIFLTAWEAGGHVVIPQLLRHPERIRAVAVVTPNFLGRCVTPPTRSLTGGEAQIPVRVFGGDKDPAWTSTSPLVTQSARFDSLARARGFRNVSDSLIKNAGHGALAGGVIGYFASLLTP